MKIKYTNKTFRAETMLLVMKANDIIAEYQADGYSLTLRQLYYQFVARDILANSQQNYSRLGSIINDARLAGLVDWNAIEDRTRAVEANPHWAGPGDIIASAANSYALDKWSDQPCRIEVWVEKEALAGVFDRVCSSLDVPYLACRGYVSQSEMWRAACRLKSYERSGQKTVILHFGDHDPSGIDMTRDIVDRLAMFKAKAEVVRLALNFSQVKKYSPPPNPAKATDSRFEGYSAQFGDESWELDALEPKALVQLVEAAVAGFRDTTKWKRQEAREAGDRFLLKKAANAWDDIASWLPEGEAPAEEEPTEDDE